MSQRRRKKLKAWPNRRLLLLWHLYRNKHATFDQVDLVYPHHYPLGMQTDSNELIRLLICATNLKAYGVELFQLSIHDFTLSIVDKDKRVIIDQKIILDEIFPDLSDILLDELGKGLNPRSRQELLRLIPAPPPDFTRQLMSRLLAGVADKVLNALNGIDQDGYGHLNPDESHSNLDAKLFTRLAPLVRPGFVIQRKRLNTSFRKYLNALENDLIQSTKGRHTFPFETIRAIFLAFLKEMGAKSGSVIHVELGEATSGLGNTEDAFTQAFRKHFPKEYKLWKSGLYTYPFFETLAWAEHNGWLRLQDFAIGTNGIGFLNRIFKGDQLMRNRNFNAVKLKAYLSLEIFSKKLFPEDHTPGQRLGEEIHLLEVVTTDRSRYKVYVNGDRKHPVYLSRSNKAGEIIYAVAEGQEVSYRRFRKNMDYINQDTNFKLYSQTDFKPTQLLARQWDEDGGSFIGPAEGVSIRLIEE